MTVIVPEIKCMRGEQVFLLQLLFVQLMRRFWNWLLGCVWKLVNVHTSFLTFLHDLEVSDKPPYVRLLRRPRKEAVCVSPCASSLKTLWFRWRQDPEWLATQWRTNRISGWNAELLTGGTSSDVASFSEGPLSSYKFLSFFLIFWSPLLFPFLVSLWKGKEAM